MAGAYASLLHRKGACRLPVGVVATARIPPGGVQDAVARETGKERRIERQRQSVARFRRRRSERADLALAVLDRRRAAGQRHRPSEVASGLSDIIPLSRSILRAPFRSIALGIRIKVRLKDRLQQQLGGCLHHSVPNSRDGGFIMHFLQWPSGYRLNPA